MTQNICLIIEYDGTRFVGWQVQPNGVSVQDVVEDALARLLGEAVRVTSSGRTDAGVHARGMAAQLRSPRQLPLKAYREGLNGLLPPDVAVREVREVDENFNVRFDAKGKWYRYTLYRSKVRSPLAARTSWHIRAPLSLPAMAEAAVFFVGHHDFSAFRTSGCAALTTERKIFSVTLSQEGDFLHVDVRGAGFLKNMVRVMVGTLVEVGLGKKKPRDVNLLLRGDLGAGRAGRTAPPQGLCLMEVWY